MLPSLSFGGRFALCVLAKRGVVRLVLSEIVVYELIKDAFRKPDPTGKFSPRRGRDEDRYRDFEGRFLGYIDRLIEDNVDVIQASTEHY